jgi:hypothetical protein
LEEGGRDHMKLLELKDELVNQLFIFLYGNVGRHEDVGEKGFVKMWFR